MKRPLAAAVALLALPLGLRAEAPYVEHQPSPCTVPGKAVSLCASITDDGQVEKARIYFRPQGQKYFSYVEMTFGGLNFCGTLPAPRPDKLKVVEYYIQAVDNEFESQRTSTFQLTVQAEGVCPFPPVETDPQKASSVTVYAMDKKQGKKLPDGFVAEGVTFVPVAR